MRVVPDVESEGQVDKATADQLHRCDDRGTHSGAEDQAFAIQSMVHMIDGVEADAAAERHRPMGIAAEEKLQGIIGGTAHGKER